MRRCFALLVLVPVLAVPLFAADEDEPPPFPGKGAAIPGPYHVLNVTGPRHGRFHCLVCRNGLSPTAALFVTPQKPDGADADWMLNWAKEHLADDAPLSKLFKKLDTVIAKNPDAYLGAYALFFAPEGFQRPLADRLVELTKALELKHIIFGVGSEDEPKSLVAKKDKDGKEEGEPVNTPWFEKRDFAIGAMIYKGYRVVDWQTFAEGKLTDKDSAAFVKDFDALVPEYARPGYKKKLKLPKQ